MRIVHCVWNMLVGGTETMLVDIMNYQVRDHDVQLVVVNDGNDPALLGKLDPRIGIINIGRPLGGRNPWHIAKLNIALRQLNADVLHLHTPSMLKAVWSKPAKSLFYTVHCLNQDIKVAKLRACDCVIAISETVATDIRRRYGVEAKVVPNGIRVDSIEKRDLARMQSKPLKIIMVGRLDAKLKGQDLLIEAAKIATNELGIDLKVDLVGVGDSLSELRELAKAAGVADRIAFRGLRMRDWIYSHLKDYDLMCHPARFDGFGLTVAEGMAACLPVLVPDKGGPFEIIGRGQYGLTFTYDDARSCAQAIMAAASDYRKCLAIAAEAYGFCKANYSLERQCQDYEKLYKATL